MRILYEGRSESPGESHRFRLAVALGSSDRMRLEVLPPVGGPRLVVIADGRRLIALDPAHRRAETWDPQARGVERLLGAALGTAEIRFLLEGHSPCSLREGSAVPECPFGAGRYRPVDASKADVRGATILDSSGRTLLVVEYPDPPQEGTSWATSLRLRRPGEDDSLLLKRTSGPGSARLDSSLFSTEAPAHFEKGTVLGEKGLAMAVGDEEAPR
ncbi:MAG TPA: hypothetical protein VFQ07_07165 [Candidatus Polarisedimenticolia bacterium]|nr:hypothetical protein [Candidatus Polarisedimenticolia bacterium]